MNENVLNTKHSLEGTCSLCLTCGWNIRFVTLQFQRKSVFSHQRKPLWNTLFDKHTVGGVVQRMECQIRTVHQNVLTNYEALHVKPHSCPAKKLQVDHCLINSVPSHLVQLAYFEFEILAKKNFSTKNALRQMEFHVLKRLSLQHEHSVDFLNYEFLKLMFGVHIKEFETLRAQPILKTTATPTHPHIHTHYLNDVIFKYGFI